MTGSVPPDPPPFPPFDVDRTERIYDSPWCGLRKDWIVLPSGAIQEYHVFEVSPAVAVVPVMPDGSVTMIWQHRHPHGRTHWEVPAGRAHAGEDPIDAARRELLEETGLASDDVTPLPGFYPMNGITPHFARLFVARSCERVAEPDHDPAERMVARAFPRAEVERRLHAGELHDGFTALALFYWLSGEAS